MRHSIRARLIMVFISLAIGPLLVVGVLLAWQSFTMLQQQALILQQEAAKRVASEVAAFFQELESELRFTVQTQRLRELSQDGQRSVLSNLLAYQSAFDEFHLLNSQGQEEAGVYRIGLASTAPVDRSQADEFVIPQTTGQIYHGPVRYDQITNEPVMTIAIPVINLRTGSVDSVLVSVARIKKVWDLIAGIQVSQGQSVYIVDTEGKVVAHRNPSVVLRGSTFTVPQQNGIQPGLSGESVVLAFETMSLGQQQFSIVAEQTVSEALALAFNTILISAGLVVIALAIAIALGLPIVRQIVQPIQTMAAAAQAISTGDLSQQIRITRQDELGILASAFNRMTAQLHGLIGTLEQQVADRTHDLEHRSAYLTATTEVSHAIASILDPDELLLKVVEVIRERFGLYYVGLFLVDEAGEWAVLQAGTGEAGQAMLARGHRIRIGEGMIGWSVAQALPRVALEAGEDAVRLATPELPDTRSEAALPLRSRGRVLGALTVQHKEPGAFDPDTMSVLQTMADQVAIAMDNARLFTASQSALEATRRAYGEMSRRAWSEILRSRIDWGYRYTPKKVTPVEGIWRAEMIQAEQSGETVRGDGGDGVTLAIPLRVRDEVVGVLGFRKGTSDETQLPSDSTADAWTSEETALLQTFAAQLEQALESAQLFQETQRRAAREQMLGEIAARIRETLDVETVLKTTVQEVRQALGVPEVAIRLAARLADQIRDGD